MSRLDEARQRVAQAEAHALTNKMGGTPLDETSLARVYGHWTDRGFAIVSADRGEREPAANRRWQDQLKGAIRADGFGFVPLDGFWYEEDKETGEKHKVAERSFLVPNKGGEVEGMDRLRAGVLRWGRIDPSNPQESVILVNPGGPVEFLNPVTGAVSFSLDRFSPGRVADIYSQLAYRQAAKRRPLRPGQLARSRTRTFVFEGWAFTPPPQSQVEAYRRRHEGEIKFFR